MLKNKYEYFKTGKLLKIVSNKKKTNYNFYVKLNTNIPYILELFYKYQNKQIYIFKTINEADNFLSSINKEE